jgi:hypothetical protein
MGRYDIRVTAGPSYTTMREEARESMLDFARYLPNSAALIADMIAENMDWPKAEAVAERLKKTLPPGIAEDDTDQEEITPQMVQQAIQEAVMATQEQLDNKIAMMEAETKRMAAESKAETDEFKALTDRIEALQANAIDEEKIKDLIAQSFAELLQADQGV